ncbi:RNA polymerase sigma factor [Haliangium sp.]|uniref:RNA polymerase sigma factor n=1 Tax=Haliangium sp. TaxID=2663208 RepID=UPI003D12E8E3
MSSGPASLADEPRNGELERSLAQGDLSLFWRFWSLHRQRLLSLCAGWLGGHTHDAEDVLSTVAIKIIESARERRLRVRRFQPWLIRSLHNACMDRHRARRASVMVSKDSTSAVATPADLLGGAQFDHAFESVLTAMPGRLRLSFTLRVLEQRGYDEIAREQAISPANARKRVQQARQWLRVALREYRP